MGARYNRTLQNDLNAESETIKLIGVHYLMLQLSYIVCRIQLRLLADLLLGIYTFPVKN